MKHIDIDLAVVGAGPAGMAAAITAHQNGLENVLLLERAEYLGGLLHQCIHNGFGLHYFREDLTGPEYAERFMNQLRNVKGKILLNTMVTSLHPDKSINAINPEWGEFQIHPKAVILSMGCRERTRHALGIPGSRPAGIYTAGLAQKLVNVDGYMPGNNFVILGSGDIGLIMARRLHLEGAKVKAVVEVLPHVGGLIRNEYQCLHDFDIPLLLRHTITEIYGNKRLEGVKIAPIGENGEPVTGAAREFPCDCLLLSVGLIPENELSAAAGVEIDKALGGPIVDEYLQTSIEGVFAAGNVLQVWDLVDNVSLEGCISADSACKYIRGELNRYGDGVRVIPGDNVRTVLPHRIVGKDDVQLTVRVKAPLHKAALVIGGFKKTFRIMSPTQVLKIALPAIQIEKAKAKGKNLVVSCVPADKE